MRHSAVVIDFALGLQSIPSFQHPTVPEFSPMFQGEVRETEPSDSIHRFEYKRIWTSAELSLVFHRPWAFEVREGKCSGRMDPKIEDNSYEQTLYHTVPDLQIEALR
jgi:hypothetical protein